MTADAAPIIAATADIVVAAACGFVILAIVALVGRRPDLAAPYRHVAALVCIFILAVGVSHALGILPEGGNGVVFRALLKAVTAIVAIAAIVLLWRLGPQVAALPSHREIHEANVRLVAEAEAHVRTLRELRNARDELEMRVAERTRDLDEARRRYELALHGSGITLFLQDEDLRYLWISKPELRPRIEDIIGITDDELLPPESRSRIINVKRAALETGENQDAEVSIATPDGVRWWILHVEPEDLKGTGRRVIHCSAFDITERKENEQKLRFFMRELTHRSKNLLAVIQAMARRTASHTEDVDDFLEKFSNRLQALSASHDLLVQQSSQGVPIGELIRSQLGYAADMVGTQIALDGPPVTLNADATQHVGLALHELATNAVKYGALSTESGRVAINWRVDEPGQRFHLSWMESGGPPVSPPAHRGFGQVVIERTVARTLDADVDLTYDPKGLRWALDAPLENVASQPEVV